MPVKVKRQKRYLAMGFVNQENNAFPPEVCNRITEFENNVRIWSLFVLRWAN